MSARKYESEGKGSNLENFCKESQIEAKIQGSCRYRFIEPLPCFDRSTELSLMSRRGDTLQSLVGKGKVHVDHSCTRMMFQMA